MVLNREIWMGVTRVSQNAVQSTPEQDISLLNVSPDLTTALTIGTEPPFH